MKKLLYRNYSLIILLGIFLFSLIEFKAYADQYYPPAGSGGGGGSGTVTSVSVNSTNGLAGTVANPTTTPSLTLSTTITGILKGNATAISAATPDTDYQSPISLTTTGTSGAATFSGDVLNIPQYSGGGGGLTSVGLQGDGTVIATSVTNSPLTSNGTLGPLTLVNAPAYTLLNNNTSSSAAPAYSYGFCGIGTWSGTTTLTANSPSYEVMSGAAATITLPVASTCPGKVFVFWNIVGSAGTVSRQGSDLLLTQSGGTANTIVPSSGSVLGYVSDGISKWYPWGWPILATNQGGTGNFAAATAGGLVYGNGTIQSYMALGTAGQIPQSAGTGTPTWTSTPGSGTAFNTITSKHYLSTGTTPSFTAGAGAGTSPTITVTGTDTAGYVTVTTGSTPSASAVVVTVTFNTAYGTTPNAVTITNAASNDAVLTGNANVWADQGGLATTGFTLNVGSTALTGATTYKWWYSIDG